MQRQALLGWMAVLVMIALYLGWYAVGLQDPFDLLNAARGVPLPSQQHAMTPLDQAATAALNTAGAPASIASASTGAADDRRTYRFQRDK